jgi:ABC-type sugar transport system ATPase subunit
VRKLDSAHGSRKNADKSRYTLESDAAIELRRITKRFSGVTALDNVSFDLRAGEIHALVGENGAGKSTLINVIAGVYQPDEGAILVFGRELRIRDPLYARDLGIAVIHQERNVVPELTVAESIFMDRYPRTRIGLIDRRRLSEDATNILRGRLGMAISPNEQMKKLSIANQQLVEIAAALSLNPRIVVLDEPTSSLSRLESERLFLILASLKSQGVSMVYISHKLDELMPIADRITVLRDGHVAGHHETAAVSRDALVAEMVGRKIDAGRTRAAVGNREPFLRIEGLSKPNTLFDIDVDFGVGEIIGIAGMVGAKRTELMRCIFGVDPDYSGDISIDGKKRRIRSIRDALNAGIALVPEDRKKLGLVLQMSVAGNVTLASLQSLFRHGWIRGKSETAIGDKYAKELRIRTPSCRQPVGKLSGGNQQKVVIAKWLASKFRLLILDEPTVGVDVGSRSEIYDIIERVAGEGACVVVVSSDLEEVLTICDRIYVMKEGRITGELSRDEATQGKIVDLAT